MESRRRLLTADGAHLTYWLRRAESRPPGPPRRLLVLLHGAASNHTRWSELVDRTRLTGRWDVLRPDLRGNGRSMWRGRLDRAVWCRDLAAILAAERVPAATFVGHSLGAQIAIEFAWRHPASTRGLALIDPIFPRALRGRERVLYRSRALLRLAAWGLRAVNRLGLGRRSFPDRDLRRLDEQTRRELAGGDSLEEIARRYGALKPILRYMPTANYLQQVLATVAPLPDLAAVGCPVLVVHSAGITFADPEVSREEIHRFPRAEVVTVAANHWPLTERPREVREAIEAWLERRGGRAGAAPPD